MTKDPAGLPLLRIGRVELDGRLVLAPMAGVTDLSFRLLCREAGASLVSTEMVSDLALLGRSRRSAEIVLLSPYEHPVAAQLCGSCPETMGKAAAALARRGVDVLDINMGCPAPKIVSNGEGAALMRDPGRASAIVAAVRSAVGAGVPITAKIRSGWDEDSINAVPFAQLLELAGVDAITVHGRVRTQFYRGRADWAIIREVKQSVRVPVIGNGDVRSGRDAVSLLEQTGCDAVMIGRGALGNPGLFTECRDAIAGRLAGDQAQTPQHGRIEYALRHLRMMLALKGSVRGLVEMRKHAAWYLAGIRGAARLRDEMMRSANPEGVVACLREALAGQGHQAGRQGSAF